ncbi:ANTAR domain-containing response regulator [Scatolibacter rhodanostii]|uniref:ANTAR domain-containing response regulator n=1 Tax=Scatolibacter rhodanostii TaxID=2014781 RepID=UPI000C072442|nr:ANTAR domain-containing protein [Scatolibacter rhodanostii]
MESVLIVSPTDKSIASFRDILSPSFCQTLVSTKSCSETRQLLQQRSFDLVIINAPLRDESGEDLSSYIASNDISQVILVVNSEHYDEISAKTEDFGVITVSKPISKSIFWSALKMAKASHNRLKALQNENHKLMKKIEDIRIVDRAKCMLISCLNMSENEAHRYIEKKAMDDRSTKRKVAEEILETYDGKS